MGASFAARYGGSGRRRRLLVIGIDGVGLVEVIELALLPVVEGAAVFEFPGSFAVDGAA